MKRILFLALLISSSFLNAATLFNQKVAGIQQYGGDGLTIVYLQNDFVSPNSCSGGPWGNKAVLLRTSEPNSDRLLSVLLAAQMADKTVDVAVKNSCDGNTEVLHWVLVR